MTFRSLQIEVSAIIWLSILQIAGLKKITERFKKQSMMRLWWLQICRIPARSFQIWKVLWKLNFCLKKILNYTSMLGLNDHFCLLLCSHSLVSVIASDVSLHNHIFHTKALRGLLSAFTFTFQRCISETSLYSSRFLPSDRQYIMTPKQCQSGSIYRWYGVRVLSPLEFGLSVSPLSLQVLLKR